MSQRALPEVMSQRYLKSAIYPWQCNIVRSETNWHFESSSRYSGLSRCVPSSSHRQVPRSSRRELGLFVSSPTSSSRRLPRSSRRDQTCRYRVRLVDSEDWLITHYSSSTRQVQSSSRRTLGSTRRELIGRDWDRIVRSTWKMEGLRGMLGMKWNENFIKVSKLI